MCNLHSYCSAQPASAYPAAAAQTAYVQPAQPAAYAAAPRPQAYETYQSTHTSGQYAYAARTQVVGIVSEIVTSYVISLITAGLVFEINYSLI